MKNEQLSDDVYLYMESQKLKDQVSQLIAIQDRRAKGKLFGSVASYQARDNLTGLRRMIQVDGSPQYRVYQSNSLLTTGKVIPGVDKLTGPLGSIDQKPS